MLESYGWVVQRVRGSHYVFGRGGAIFPVPHHGGTVKAPYVRQALALTEGEDDAEE
ncbi:MAG: type II toxin-antitoxin system HicA family toxin [Chloroflexi bacterium]|nr:type II toxin-antitoxin system HicA family toxin [Chloroflexota bacterium]